MKDREKIGCDQKKYSDDKMSYCKILGKDQHYGGNDRAEDRKPSIFQQIKRKIFIENKVLTVFHNGRLVGQRITADRAFLACVDNRFTNIAFFQGKRLLCVLFETIIAYRFV